MNSSSFNQGTSVNFVGSGEIPLPSNSERYRYFKVKKGGLLQFLKRPSPAYVSDMVTIEALRKEFILCFPLSHPSITRYIEFSDNTLYEEFVDGETIAKMIADGDKRLDDPKFIRKIAVQLFEGLDYLHHQGILHLDIKPENLMISRIGDNLKIIDFSCAKSAVCENTGGFTAEYMAPEQGKGNAACTTDIYLAGQVIGQLAQRLPGFSRWKKFVGKATDPEVAKRYQSAREALECIPDDKPKNSLGLFYIVLLIAIAGVAIAFFLRFPVAESEREMSRGAADAAMERVTPDTLGETNMDVKTAIAPPEQLRTEDKGKKVEIEPLKPIDTQRVSKGGGLRAKLEKDIDSHIRTYFKTYIFPYFPDTVISIDDYKKSKIYPIMVDRFDKAYDDAMEYGRKLGNQYPEEKEFISSQVIKSFSTQNGIIESRIKY